MKYKPKPFIYKIPCSQVIPDLMSLLYTNGIVRVEGLGDFSLRQIASREGWNPITKKLMVLPAYQKVHFKPATKFTNYFKD